MPDTPNSRRRSPDPSAPRGRRPATRSRSAPETPGSKEFDFAVDVIADTARRAHVVVNAIAAAAAVETISAIGPDVLDGKTLIDVTNALGFRGGRPDLERR